MLPRPATPTQAGFQVHAPRRLHGPSRITIWPAALQTLAQAFHLGLRLRLVHVRPPPGRTRHRPRVEHGPAFVPRGRARPLPTLAPQPSARGLGLARLPRIRRLGRRKSSWSIPRRWREWFPTSRRRAGSCSLIFSGDAIRISRPAILTPPTIRSATSTPSSRN